MKNNILQKMSSFQYDKNRKEIAGIKSAIVWGNLKDTNGYIALLYISKPRGISQKDFEFLLDKLDIQIRK